MKRYISDLISPNDLTISNMTRRWDEDNNRFETVELTMNSTKLKAEYTSNKSQLEAYNKALLLLEKKYKEYLEIFKGE